MISAARVLGLAAAAAVLLSLNVIAIPASAQDACKGDRIVAKSEIRVRGETFATNEAKEKWEKLAEERFGRSYRRWANAKDTNVECESAKSPRVGLPAKVCTAYGRPCSRDERAEEREGDRKNTKRDKIGDRDDERHIARRRSGYETAMRFQDEMAERRDRAEKRAYRREAAYWRSLYRRGAYGWD